MNRAGFGVLLFVLIALSAVFAPQLSGYDPRKPNYRALYAPMSAEHPLGTDGLGRDVLSRSLAGGRVSLLIALSASVVALALGAGLGVVAAGIGGATDTVISRVFDALLAFPGFLLILLVVVSLGGGSLQTLMAMGVAGSPVFFRLARAFTRAELGSEYVTAARALGASRTLQLLRHAVPNFLGSIVVQLASTAAAFLLVEASLSFLGLGVPLPTPSWGNVLQDARSYLTTQPWAAVGPGVFLAAASLSFQFMSDGLRDVLDHRS